VWVRVCVGYYIFIVECVLLDMLCFMCECVMSINVCIGYVVFHE